MPQRPLVGALFVAVLVVLGIGLLYTYRAQTPAAQEIAFSQALAEIQAGHVQSVTVKGDRARIVTQDGRVQETVVPDRDDSLARVVQEHNKSDPAHPTQVTYEPSEPSIGVVGAVILSLLPIVVLVATIFAGAWALARARDRGTDRYAQLTTLADLRDRGVISEDEFQREKRKILG